MSSAIISTQPTAASTLKLDVKEFNFHPERQHARHYHECQCSTSSFFSRHRAKIGSLIVLLLFSISAAAVLFWSDIVQESANTGGLGLWKRVANNTQDNSFVNRKLYLIIIFVGLFLCLVAGIMLASCCCRESFKNPLCCPCYTCACCGGLACLECIGCGLCFEGLEQV